jgi:glycosyltransferase involved in cell wall biosynthesis
MPHYWPDFNYGGPVASVHSLNKALARKGIDITVYTTNVNLDDKVKVNQEIKIDAVKVTYFEFKKLFEFMGSAGWQFSLGMKEALKNNLKAFDLVYLVNVWSYPAAIAAYYSRLYGKPYIVVTSGMHYPDTFSKKAWKKTPYYHLVVKKILQGACAIHYTTEDEARKTNSFLRLKNRAIIIPNGVDMSEFSDLPDKERLRLRYPYLKDKKIILFLGRIHWIKGLDILLRAYAALIKEKDDVHLVIAGNDEAGYARKVKKWVRKYKMDYRVTFTGLLMGKEKIEAYSGSDIFVLPSYSENFGMSVAEAMACGLAVVISDKVGIHNDIRRNKAGIIVQANAESLYQGVKLLLENPDLRKEIAFNGRKLVEECYDIDKVADKMIEAYSKPQHF